MKLRAFIKRNARHALRRNWCRAASISLIAIIFSTLFITLEKLLAAALGQMSITDYLLTPSIYLDDLPNVSLTYMALLLATAVLELLLLTPVSLGVKRWFYLLGDGKPSEALSIFEYFMSRRRYFKAVLLRFSLFVIKFVTSVVFLSPVAALYCFARLCGGAGAGEAERLISAGLYVSAAALGILLGVLLLIWLTRYYLAQLVMIEYEDLSVWGVIKTSASLSKGRRLHLLAFQLSFLGWRILDMLIIPKLFTLPYRCTAQGLYARYIFEMARRESASPPAGDDAAEADTAKSGAGCEENAAGEENGQTEDFTEQFDAVFSDEVIILGGDSAAPVANETEADENAENT